MQILTSQHNVLALSNKKGSGALRCASNCGNALFAAISGCAFSTNHQNAATSAQGTYTVADLEWAAGIIDGDGHFRMDREKYPSCTVSTHEDGVETLYKLQNPFGRTVGRIFDNSGVRVDGRPTFKDESPSCIEWAAGVLDGCGCLKFDTTLEKAALSATVSLERYTFC